jgi:hypothetical protein
VVSVTDPYGRILGFLDHRGGLEKMIVFLIVTKFPDFTEHECLLPCSKNLLLVLILI